MMQRAHVSLSLVREVVGLWMNVRVRMRRKLMRMRMSVYDQAVSRGGARRYPRVNLLRHSCRGADPEQYQNDRHAKFHRQDNPRGHRQFENDYRRPNR